MPASAGTSPAAARASASKAAINPVWWQNASATVLALLIVGNALRWLFLDGADPYRCGALMSKGEWMDPGVFKQWQPEGCNHKSLGHHAYFHCLSSGTPNTAIRLVPPHKRVVTFIGDSSVRQLFFAAVRLVDGGSKAIPKDWSVEGEKHSDRRLTFYEGAGTGKEEAVEMEFLWDPYLNSTKLHDLLHRTSATLDPSAMLVMGSGLWYLRNPSSGGLPAWGEMIHSTFEALKIAQGSPSAVLQSPWDSLASRSSLLGRTTSSLDERQLLKPSQIPFGVSDAIVFLPIVDAVQSRLSPARAETIHHTDIEAMNADLVARLAHPQPPPIIVPTVFNDMLVESETEDGLHFSDKMMDRQAEILLGWRCNDVLRKQGLIGEGMCCAGYNWVRPVQGVIITLLAIWAPLGWYLQPRLPSSSALQRFLPSAKLSAPLSAFGLAIVYLFLADRSTLMFKENKVYDATVVGGLMLVFAIAGLATTKNAGKDGGFLGRDMTDEWKGWMQIAILIYHFFGASKVSGIYNPIRVMVAAYLFMTGYGHFFFYYKKADFGFKRVFTVLVRLNLLSVVLPYTMNTDYAFYYFAPLVSWWYLIIYTTMALGSKYNQSTPFLVSKLMLAAAIVTAIMHFSVILETIFAILHTVFNIRWDATEWSFRVSLDLFIVWAGMLSAFAYIKIKEAGIPELPSFSLVRAASVALAGLGLLWYAWFELRYNKFAYNALHPYVSIVPVLSFVILRNSTPLLRSCSSLLFQFIGQCSLETFILQFHGWLASDTKAILLVIPATNWRPVNLVLSSIVFVWLSYTVSKATGELTDYIVKSGAPQKQTPAALPRPVTASVIGDGDATKDDSIPLMGLSEKEAAEAEAREQDQLLAEEIGITPAQLDDEGRRESWPAWMSDTASRFSSRASVYARPSRNSSRAGVMGIMRNILDAAGNNLGVKTGLIILGLWVLNWLY